MGIEVVKICRHCEAFIKPKDKICPFCKKETAYPVLEKYAELNFDEIKEKINNSFYLLESFMQDRIEDYQYFGFNDAFTKLFIELRKPENFTYDNCTLINMYWSLTEQIRYDYDKSDFDNSEAYENEMFFKDCEEIMYLNWNRADEFTAFTPINEITERERKFSITDILNTTAVTPQQIETKANKLKAPQPVFKLKIDQIALKYAYKGMQITRENGNQIAKEYGHNSGEKLFQRFTYYSSAANRKGKPTPCTPKKLDNKIKLIESIIDFLPTDKQERAKDEVLILKNIYDAEYQ